MDLLEQHHVRIVHLDDFGLTLSADILWSIMSVPLLVKSYNFVLAGFFLPSSLVTPNKVGIVESIRIFLLPADFVIT